MTGIYVKQMSLAAFATERLSSVANPYDVGNLERAHFGRSCPDSHPPSTRTPGDTSTVCMSMSSVSHCMRLDADAASGSLESVPGEPLAEWLGVRRYRFSEGESSLHAFPL
jgi:hypothetical protein